MYPISQDMAMSNLLTGPAAEQALQPLRKSQVALLTTFRRDGTGVGTPVNLTLKGDTALFSTRSRTWKVKRLRNNPEVTLAPCTRKGKPIGETVRATTRKLSDDEVKAYTSSFQFQLWRLIYRVVYRDVPVSYGVYPLGA